MDYRNLSDAPKEAFTRWKEAGYAKVAAAEKRGVPPPSVPATSKASKANVHHKAHESTAAPKPKAKAKPMCVKFLKGECNDDNCSMTHSRAVRSALVGATITPPPAKPKGQANGDG